MDLVNKQYKGELLLINSNVITLDRFRPKANWTAIAGDKIVGLGNKQELALPVDSKAKIIDCKGKTVLPGFIDTHLHLLSFAESLVSLNLNPSLGIHSIRGIQSKIRRFTRDKPWASWIRGKGYNEFYLVEKRHPNRWDLDKAAPNHPVKLTHRSGHAHVLNSLALKMVGIGMETPDPPGGMVDRDLETGIPTGLVYEMGHYLSDRIPPIESKELEKGIKMADRELISNGITSVHDASSQNDLEQWNLFKSWKERGLLSPRVKMMLGIENFEENRIETFLTQLDPNQLQVNGVKIILDETTGRLHPPQAELEEFVLRVHKSEMQAAIHAVEEIAIKSACSAIENALKKIPRMDHRHRIEHCSVCPPSLAKRLASGGIRVVTQPPFLYCNGDRYLETVENEQLKYLYPFGTLLRTGVRVAASSDSPFAPTNPLIGLSATMTRKSDTGKRVTQKEALPAIDALRMYTKYAAEATFEEGIMGSITPGKLADLVILSGDPLTSPPDEVKDLQVEMTIINGEVVWDKGN